jgi:hypothetical protein
MKKNTFEQLPNTAHQLRDRQNSNVVDASFLNCILYFKRNTPGKQHKKYNHKSKNNYFSNPNKWPTLLTELLMILALILKILEVLHHILSS